MSFALSLDGQADAVAEQVGKEQGWGDTAVFDKVKAFLVGVLPHFDSPSGGVGVDVDVSGHVDANSANLTITVRRTRLFLDETGPAQAGGQT